MLYLKKSRFHTIKIQLELILLLGCLFDGREVELERSQTASNFEHETSRFGNFTTHRVNFRERS